MAIDFTITRTEDGRAWLERPGDRPKALGTPFQSEPLLQLWEAYLEARQAREEAKNHAEWLNDQKAALEKEVAELRAKLEAKHKK